MESTRWALLRVRRDIGLPHHELPKTLESGLNGGMVGLRLPIFLAFPTAFLLNNPLIRVSGNTVLRVDRDNHLSTSTKLSRPLIYTIELLRKTDVEIVEMY